ncbi:MAG: pilus assembly protein N-terminal domain-containing protein [Acidobacteriota bacterium]|nr:pilus assembly protein N-terminal domain-containing protein [Acidobacteriota bacterium]
MRFSSHTGCSLSALLIGLLAVTTARTADAPIRNLEMSSGQGTVLDFRSDVTRVYTSNPEVADPTVITSREILVNAKAPGAATLLIWLQSGERQSLSVSVTADLGPARKLLHDTFPTENLTLNGSREALSLVGRVSAQEVSDRAVLLLKPFAQSVVSNLEIVSPRGLRQIGLHVVFAELNRNATESFGVNLLSTGAGNTPGRTSTGQFAAANPTQVKGAIGDPLKGASTTFNLNDALNIFAFRPDLNIGATIRALENKGLLQILAEPNLVASEGKEARFTVGGEFPIPVAQGGATPGAITIQFREFGIRLSFLPTVTPNGTIRMHVMPEVSTIDLANGVVLNGFSIPALSTRRMETDIELREGQSFVIAGLLDNRVTENLSRIPGLADIPILGALFRSHDRVKSKTELIILVTPTMRFPLPDGAVPPLPVMPEPFLSPLPVRVRSDTKSDKNE